MQREGERPARRPGLDEESRPGRWSEAVAGLQLAPPLAHDPEWWLRRLAERESATGVLPPAITMSYEDARLDEAIDREDTESGVRQIIDEFNRRVVEARRCLAGGPPVITPTRVADREVELWRERRRCVQR